MRPRRLTPEMLCEQADFVRSLARSLLGEDAALAEDVSQEALLAGLERPPRLRGDPAAWLRGVVKNLARKAWRSRERRRRHETAATAQESGEPAAAAVARLELQHRVAQAVLALAEPFRTAILLRYYEGLSAAEIARRLNVPAATVRGRLRRGLGRLRTRLERAHGGERALWAAPLAAFARATKHPRRVAVLTMGALAMKKLAVVCCLVVCAALVVWTAHPFASPEGVRHAVLPYRNVSEQPRSTVSAPQARVFESLVQGVVRKGGEPVAASVRVRLLARKPPQAPFDYWLKQALDDVSFRLPGTGVTVVASRRTGEDGRFSVKGLTPGLYEVFARDDKGAGGFADVAIPVEGAHEAVEVRLCPDSTEKKGRVLRGDGTPVPCFVIAEFEGELPSGYAPIATGKNGSYAFGPADRVRAVEPGRLSALVRGVIDPGPVMTEGRVVDADTGDPIAGAVVEWKGRHEQGTLLLRADAAGSFRMGLQPGGASVTVRAPGHLVRWVRLSPNGATRVALARGGSVAGVVRDGAGASLAGVTVFGCDPHGKGVVSTSTDEKGRYRLDGLKARVSVFVFGDGRISRGFVARLLRGYDPYVVAAGFDGPAERDLVAVRAARIHGSVIDEDGKPVAGVMVSLKWNEDRSLPDRLQHCLREAATDASGEFSIDTVPPGVGLRCEARAPGRLPLESKSLRVAAGDSAEVTLRLKSPRYRTIHITDRETGEPLCGVEVWVKGIHVDWKTHEDGSVRIGPLPSGPLEVGTWLSGYLPWPASNGVVQHAPVPDGKEPFTIRLEKGLEIDGRIVLPESAPFDRVRFLTTGVDAAQKYFVGDASARRVGENRFAVVGLRPGLFRVQATLTWQGGTYRAVGRARSGTDDLVLRLARVGNAASNTPSVEVLKSWRLRIVDPEGRPVASYNSFVRAGLYSSYGGSSSDMIVAAGSEPVEVTLWRFRDLADRPLPWAPVHCGPYGPEGGQVVIRLERGASIEGRVVGADGAGLRGIEVLAAAEEGPVSGDSVTDATGEFRIVGLDHSRYRVQAKLPSDLLGPDPPVVVAGGARGVEIPVRSARSVHIQVLVEDGSAPMNAQVAISRDSADSQKHSSVSKNADTNGLVAVDGLNPRAAYKLEATADGCLSYAESGWMPRDETIRLQRALPVGGVVKDAEGEGVPRAHVYAEGPGGFFEERETGPDGTFDAGSCASGTVTLRASMKWVEKADRGSLPAVVVPAGTKAILHVDAGAFLRVQLRGWKAGPWEQAKATLSCGGTYIDRVSQFGDGTLAFAGLDPGKRYDLWIGPSGDGSVVDARGLKPGPAIQKLEVQQGTDLVARVEAPAGIELRSLQCYARVPGTVVMGFVTSEGELHIRGLPAGTWPVVADVIVKGVTYRGEARLSTERPGTIDLAAK